MFQLEHRSAFTGNTVEIAENSENHLKAMVRGRQVAGRVWFSGRTGKVVEKPQGEGKAAKEGQREWQSGAASANYMDLRESTWHLLRRAVKVSTTHFRSSGMSVSQMGQRVELRSTDPSASLRAGTEGGCPHMNHSSEALRLDRGVVALYDHLLGGAAGFGECHCCFLIDFCRRVLLQLGQFFVEQTGYQRGTVFDRLAVVS